MEGGEGSGRPEEDQEAGVERDEQAQEVARGVEREGVPRVGALGEAADEEGEEHLAGKVDGGDEAQVLGGHAELEELEVDDGVGGDGAEAAEEEEEEELADGGEGAEAGDEAVGLGDGGRGGAGRGLGDGEEDEEEGGEGEEEGQEEEV